MDRERCNFFIKTKEEIIAKDILWIVVLMQAD